MKRSGISCIDADLHDDISAACPDAELTFSSSPSSSLDSDFDLMQEIAIPSAIVGQEQEEVLGSNLEDHAREVLNNHFGLQ